MPTLTIYRPHAPAYAAAWPLRNTISGVNSFLEYNEPREDKKRAIKTSVPEPDSVKKEIDLQVNTQTEITDGRRTEADVDATEAIIDKALVTKEFKVNCNKDMQLLKIMKYPNVRHDEPSAILSHVLVKEQDSKPFRMGAIVINDASIKGNDNITQWNVLSKYPEHSQALEAALKDSTPSTVHAFRATLRYSDDFVLALIAPPIDDMTPNAHVDDLTNEDSLKYNIVVRHSKHHQAGNGTTEENVLSRYFKRFDEKLINEIRLEAPVEPVTDDSMLKRKRRDVDESHLPRESEEVDSHESFVPLGGIDDFETPIKPREPHADITLKPTIGMKRAAPQHYQQPSVRYTPILVPVKNETLRQPSAFDTFASVALPIGTALALSAGATYMLAKRPRLAE
uniref:p53-like1 protein n=1 Tax=Hyposoter didymator TaxID=260305 RepID=B9W4A2_HYPDD|nr:unknown [Hyposoter didymator]CAR31590.1 p53-like1 protein [Hyposoter didymator]